MSSPRAALFVVATLVACAPVPTAAVVALPASVVPACAAAETAAGAPREEPLQIKDGIPYFQGKVLHPGALRELGASLADARPIDVAVDLEGVQASNRYYRPAVVREHFVDFNDDDLLGKGGSFTYVFLGVTPGRTYAFETYDSGGGSGIFMNVLLVRIERDTARVDDKMEPRWVMKRVGIVALGDRADGKVTLAGSSLTLGASRYQPAERVIKID